MLQLSLCSMIKTFAYPSIQRVATVLEAVTLDWETEGKESSLLAVNLVQDHFGDHQTEYVGHLGKLKDSRVKQLATGMGLMSRRHNVNHIRVQRRLETNGKTEEQILQSVNNLPWSEAEKGDMRQMILLLQGHA